MIIELDTKKSKDNLIICAIFTVITVVICDDWEYWHIPIRFFWVSVISGLIKFKYLSIFLKSITIFRAFLLIIVFGSLITTFKILLFVHLDIYIIFENAQNNNDVPLYNRVILDLLMIDLQCSYMLSLCASLWMFVKLSKHFGYLNEWKHIVKTIIPHSLTLFLISNCPDNNIKIWWLSLGLYRSFIAITQLLFESGFTSFFDTKDGSIGIKNSSLNSDKISSKISSNIELLLNILSLIRHLYFVLFVAGWLMIPLLIVNMYGMTKHLLQEGRKNLQLTLKL